MDFDEFLEEFAEKMDNLSEQLSKTSNSTDCENEFLRKRAF